jgi:predicted RNase H-like nuclease
MQLIGLDVGFSAKKATSAVATLAATTISVGRATAVANSRNKLLSDVSAAAVIAIDAPLMPTFHTRIRSCERLFARGQFQCRCKAGFSHVTGTGLALRNAGFESAAQFDRLASTISIATRVPLVHGPRNIVEAFPNAFLGVCVSTDRYAEMPKLQRGQKFDWLYAEWCRAGSFRLLVEKLASVLPELFASRCEKNHDHEERAALVCLATAASVAAGRYTAVGDPIGGYFFLPPWSLWADWARQEVDKQRQKDAQISIWIDGASFGAGAVLPVL